MNMYLKRFCALCGVGALALWAVACTIDTFPTPTPCQTSSDCQQGQTCNGSVCAGLQGQPPGTQPPQPTATACRSATKGLSWASVGGDIRGLAFGPGTELIAAGGPEPGVSRPAPGTITVLDSSDATAQKSLGGFQGGVHRLAYHPAGTYFASTSVSGEVIVWDAKTLKKHKVLSEHKGEIVGLAFSPDGAYLASGGFKQDSSIRIWSTSTWKRTQALVEPFVGYSLSLVFSPDSSKLFSGGYTAQVWDASTGIISKDLGVKGNPTRGVDWHPDGSQVAYGQPDGSITLADPSTGKAKANWKAHDDRVSGVVFARDGKSLISIGLDGKIHIWNTATQASLATIDPKQGVLRSLAMHPNGHTFATSSANGDVTIWKCAP